MTEGLITSARLAIGDAGVEPGRLVLRATRDALSQTASCCIASLYPLESQNR